MPPLPPFTPPSTTFASLSTPALLALLKPQTRRSSRFTNWASTYSSVTTATFTPTTIEEVRMVVELARREGKELRPSGSGHSPSDLVCTDGFVVNVDKMGRLLEVDSEKCLVYVEGGVKISSLHKLLAPHSLAMSNLGSISDQTLAGALSTATHGTGVKYGNMSTFITFLDLVLPLPDAPVVRVSEELDPELFKSALCGLGAVGVIVGVGLQCEKSFNLEEECWTIKFEDFVERWKEIAESAEHVRCWWFPQVGEVKVSRLNRTNKALTPRPPIFQTWVIETLLAQHFHALALTVARLFPNILPYHAHLMYALVHRPAPIATSQLFAMTFPKVKKSPSSLVPAGSEMMMDRVRELGGQKKEGETGTISASSTTSNSSDKITSLDDLGPLPMLCEPTYRVDASNNIFNYDCGFPQYTYEGSVPYESTGACLTALETWLTGELNDPKGIRQHFPLEVRFVEKDDIYLSPTYGGRGSYIGTIQYRPWNLAVPYKKLFNLFESILLRFGGRPHWAKSHNVSRTQLGEMYPMLEKFLQVRERVDPQGILVNAYVKRHLLGQVGEEVDMRKYKATKRVVA